MVWVLFSNQNFVQSFGTRNRDINEYTDSSTKYGVKFTLDLLGAQTILTQHAHEGSIYKCLDSERFQSMTEFAGP